jgi:hypothetical protein
MIRYLSTDMEFKFDKKAVRKYNLGEEPKDFEYWLLQTPEKRIAAIEMLRLQYYGPDKFKQGFQRVYRTVKQEQG